jgi:hypothetical protein
MTRAFLACAALSTAIGCRESPPRNAPADRSVGAVAVVQSTGPAPLPSCPGTGHWEPCTIFDRLERAGLAPQRGDTITKPFLRVAGVTWRIGAASIHIFRYRDSVARHTDSAALDSLHARPRGDTVTMWAGTPTLLVNDNILAVLLSDNAEQVERVSLALTAGPPPKAGAAAPK